MNFTLSGAVSIPGKANAHALAIMQGYLLFVPCDIAGFKSRKRLTARGMHDDIRASQCLVLLREPTEAGSFVH